MNIDSQIQAAINSLRKGEPVLIYDSDEREAEVDIVLPVKNLAIEKLRMMRSISNNGFFATISYEFAHIIGLLPMTSMMSQLPAYPFLRFGNHVHKPNFTLPIDFVDCKSGVSLMDISLTLNALADLYQCIVDGVHEINPLELFAKKFIIPGHMQVIVSANGLLSSRQGHTELGLFLAELADTSPVLVSSELLDKDSGDIISLQQAQSISKSTTIPLISGEDIISVWNKDNSN